MTEVTVQAGEASYPVRIGAFSLESHRMFVISDDNVWAAHGAEFAGLGPALVLPPGERTKSAEQWARCLSWLAESGADRSSLVLAVGGGVVGDLAGFAAATYMRGVRWAVVATSLLAQIDAAVGGKSGIDLPQGKNLAGAFHQPIGVWCDPAHLKTLPERHYRAAMAEAAKYGVVVDEDFLRWQEAAIEPLKERDADSLAHLVHECVRRKAEIVAQDPLERTGRRAVLNFGHTVGHALETAMKYEGALHGEAVMIGMIAEAEIAERIGIGPAGLCGRLEEFARAWGMSCRMAGRELIEPMMRTMLRDKKAVSGKLAMALPDGPGSCRLVPDVDADLVRRVLTEI